MLRYSHLEPERQRWCAFFVLLAVCSLTVSLATRYSSSDASWLGHSFSTSTTVPTTSIQKPSIEPGRQRLLNKAAAWNPPFDSSASLLAPVFYPRIAPTGLPAITLLLAESLYNRPPPSC